MNMVLIAALAMAQPPQFPQVPPQFPVKQPCLECGGNCQCVDCDCCVKVKPAADNCTNGTCRIVPTPTIYNYPSPVNYVPPINYAPVTYSQPIPQHSTYNAPQPVYRAPPQPVYRQQPVYAQPVRQQYYQPAQPYRQPVSYRPAYAQPAYRAPVRAMRGSGC